MYKKTIKFKYKMPVFLAVVGWIQISFFTFAFIAERLPKLHIDGIMIIFVILFMLTLLVRKIAILLFLIEYVLSAAKIYNPREFNINLFFLIMGITAFILSFMLTPMTRSTI